MRFRLLAIGLIAGLLAACTSSKAGPKPTPSPTSPVVTTSAVTTSPAPSRTGPLTTGPNVRPGEKPPVYPELAKHHSASGALAFAIYYFKAYDWGYATNDPSLVEKISSSSCHGCFVYINGLRSLAKDHETLHGGRITFKSSSVSENTYRMNAEYVADIVLDEEPVILRATDSARTAAPGVTNDHSLVFVNWRHGVWQVVAVTAK